VAISGRRVTPGDASGGEIALLGRPTAPIVLKVRGPDGRDVAVPMVPKRALALAQELLTDFTRSNDGVRSEDAQVLRSC